MGNESNDRVSRRLASRRRPRRRGAQRRRWLAALVLALVLVAGACSSGDDDTETDASEAGDESAGEAAADFESEDDTMEEADDGDFDLETDDGGDAMAEDEEAQAEGEPAEGDVETPSVDTDPDGETPLGAGGASVTPTAADLGRQLIFTAFLSVGVDDVAAASAEATEIIEGLGGFLFGQSTEGGPQARSELTFKVLPADFNRALEQLGAVGELRNQTVTTDDVTERVVDLRSRIEVAELGVARLRTALEETTGLEDYAAVERLLLDRESQLEVMRGQLRTLQDRIDLATITLLLSQERVENAIGVELTTYEGFDEGRSCTGNRELSVEENTDVTVCFEITNFGDQTLTDIVLTDSVLEIDADTELIPVFGDLEELAPGQSALVAFETEVERTLRLRTRVVATPTDGVSADPVGPSVTGQDNAEVRTFPSDDGPGFGDGFGAAVDLLRSLWTALTVTVGFLLPLLILTPLVWLGWLGVRALRRRRPPRGPVGGPAPVVPPPPPPLASVGSPTPTTGSAPPADNG